MKRRTLILTATGVAMAGFVGLGPLAGNTKAVSEARRAADLVPQDGRLLVDIREPSEWKETGVIQGARLHSWRSAEAFVNAFGDQIGEGREILLICRSGNRSSRAARQLADYLDREVVDVSGGMLRIAREGEARIVPPTARMGCASC